MMQESLYPESMKVLLKVLVDIIIKCIREIKPPACLVFLLLFFLLSHAAFFYGVAEAEGLKILESGPWGMIVEFSSPELQVSEKKAGGEVYQVVTIPDAGATKEEGKPQLPIQSSLMAVPPQAEVSLEVLEQETEVLENMLIYPAPKRVMVSEDAEHSLEAAGAVGSGAKDAIDAVEPEGAVRSVREEFTVDSAWYTQDRWDPQQPFSIDFDGCLRYQRVARLSIYPVQYNPALRKARFCRKAKLKILFKEGASQVRSREITQTRAREGDAAVHGTALRQSGREFEQGEFEQVLEKTLFNYSMLKEQPQIFIPPVTSTPPVAPISPVTHHDLQDTHATQGTQVTQSSQVAQGTQATQGAQGAQGREEKRRARSFDQQLPPLKISLEQEGFYHIGGADLQRAGWKLDLVVPQKLKMYHQGREIPLSICGAEDGLFHLDDKIVFWGAAINSPYTRKNIYWLYQEDEGEGLRVKGQEVSTEQEGASDQKHEVVDHFIDHLHLEANPLYWQTMPGDMKKDRWLWKSLTAPTTANFSFSLSRISSFKDTAALRIAFQGKTDIPALNPDHHLIVSLNGNVVDDFSWDGQTEYIRQMDVSTKLLQEGNNVIVIKSPGDTGAVIDTVYLNWIELDYPRLCVAQNNQLLFSMQDEGGYDFQVGGFSEKGISVFAITDPENVLKINNISIEADGNFIDAEGNSGYRVKFSATVAGSERYAVLTAGAEKLPLSIESTSSGLAEGSDLQSTENGADYIIITHSSFLSSIQPLAEYRKSQGLRVRVVDVQDIYDQFSYGIFDPQAIQDFLRFCFWNWVPPAPLYVLLVGDANMDYLDNYNTKTPNYVPTHLYFTSDIGETPNDNWFVCVNGEDILPDMFLGRIPVRTPAEVQAVVEKIISCEQQGHEPWQQRALFVADNADPEFVTLTDGLIQNFLPSNFEARKVYAADYATNEAVTEQIKKQISEGCLVTTYCGHGNTDQWGSTYFRLSNVSELENSGQPTFALLLTCLNGFFPHPKQNCCMAEALLRAEKKGALACWASVSVSYPTEQESLSDELFDLIFNKRSNTLGACTTASRINNYSQHKISGDIAQNYLLFGDPATRLQGEYGPKMNTQIIMRPGTNLSGFSGLSASSPWMAKDLLEYLSSQGIEVEKIQGYDPANGGWQTAVWQNGSLKGVNFEISPSQGYLLYTEGNTDQLISLPSPDSYPYYMLSAGYNLLNFPVVLDDYTSYDLLQEVGEDYALNLLKYDHGDGRWEKSYFFFGHPAGEEYQVERNRGYIIWMSRTKDNWRPEVWDGKN